MIFLFYGILGRAYKIVGFGLIFGISVSACNNKKESDALLSENTVIPKTSHPIEPITTSTPQRVADLTTLAIALEKYKRDHRSYPVSSDSGDGWDSVVSSSGEFNPFWIKGLVPDYIETIPRDPRGNLIPNNQYIYRSNGAHYKLIALTPDDVDLVWSKYPRLFDSVRSKSYGFWTRGAFNW